MTKKRRKITGRYSAYISSGGEQVPIRSRDKVFLNVSEKEAVGGARKARQQGRVSFVTKDGLLIRKKLGPVKKKRR